MNQAERDFQTDLITAASAFGWRIVHFRPAKTAKGYRTAYEGDGGFPDCVIARNGCVIFAELKSTTGRARADQWEWLATLAGCTVEEFQRDAKRSAFGGCVINATNLVAIWRPKHWPMIQRILQTWIAPQSKGFGNDAR